MDYCERPVGKSGYYCGAKVTSVEQADDRKVVRFCEEGHRVVYVRCHDGWMDCTRFTNTCSCGADFNGSGDRLTDRECWGEETGESIADILSVDFR